MNEKRENPRLSTIIPAFNEGDTIGITLNQLQRSLSKHSFYNEIIVVDDGSFDNTGIIAREHGADKVIRNYRSQGKNRAIAIGLECSKESIIVLMDADGKYDPNDIPNLISPIEKGEADIVIGLNIPQNGISQGTKVANIIFEFLYRFLTGKILRTGYPWSGLKIFRREILMELVKSDFQNGIDFNLELKYFALKNKYRLIEIPLRTRLRKSVGYSRPEKRRTFRYGLKILKRILLEAVNG